MSERGARFIGPVLLSETATTLYTVALPVTYAHLLDLHVFNNDGGSVDFTLSIGTDAAGTRLYDAAPIATKTSLANPPRLVVLNTGDFIQAFASATNKLTITWSGIEIVEEPRA